MENTSFIDSIMGFNPAEVVNSFNQPAEKQGNTNIYRTNPKNSTSEDGHYHSTIRVLLNPFNIKRSIIHQATYAMTDENGFFMVKSALGNGDKNCPLFKAWKQLWFSGDEVKKDWSKEIFDKSESDWVLVQIIEDDNQPELKGQFKVMKIPKAIMARLQAKMNPTDGKKAPQPLMDYLFGPVLEMDVQPGPDDPKNPGRKNREISYDLCDFGTDVQPIIKTDGTPLFDDEQIETIESYYQAQLDMLKAKTESKRAEAESRKNALRDDIRELYSIAVEYMKGNALDIEDECSYKPWDERTTERVNNWIEKVLRCENPQYGPNPVVTSSAPAAAPSGDAAPKSAPAAGPVIGDDELPF